VTPLLEIDSVRAIIAAARHMVDELESDALLPRLLDVLQRILPQDRDELLDILEYDVYARTIIAEDNVWARYKLHPNPFARLYNRADAPEPEHGLLYEKTVRSARMAVRTAMRVPRPPAWRANRDTITACARLTAEQRDYVYALSTRIRGHLRARTPA
jgi:hypothetical protein